MGTGAAVSVIVIVLSIGIHQYNPFIIPKVLGKALNFTRIAHKLIIEGYDTVWEKNNWVPLVHFYFEIL